MPNVHSIIQQLDDHQAQRFLELSYNLMKKSEATPTLPDPEKYRQDFFVFFENENAGDMARLLLHSIAEEQNTAGAHLRKQVLRLESDLEVQRQQGPMRGGVGEVFFYAMGVITALGVKISFEKENGNIKFHLATGLLAIPELAKVFNALKSRIESKQKPSITISNSKNIMIDSDIKAEGKVHVGDIVYREADTDTQ